MEPKITFSVDTVLDKIKRMVSLSRDLSPVLLKIRGEPLNPNPFTVIGGVMNQFATQGNFFGSQWRDLSNKPYWAWWEKPAKKYEGGYQEWKTVHFPGKTMLRANDKLFSAVTIPGREGNVETLTPTSIAWGVNSDEIPYAKWHMTGTKKMPARPFMGITTQQRDAWKVLIAQFLLETGQA